MTERKIAILATRRIWDKKAGDYVTEKFTLLIDTAALVDNLATSARDNRSHKSKIARGAVTLIHDGRA